MSLKDRILGAFKRGHPDVYKAISEYADKQGISVADAIAAASSAYVMASGEEGKARLEELMAERRTEKPSRGGGDLKDSLEQVTALLKSFTGVFGAMNELRSSVSIKSTVEDYKSIASAAKEIQSAGASGGAGSVDDVIAQAFVEALVGGALRKRLASGTKTGTTAGKEVKVEE